MRLRILKEGKWVATLVGGPLEPGPQTVEWDGAKRFGRLLDGAYDAVLEVDRRGGDRLGHAAVRLGHAAAGRAGDAAVPAADLGERARPPDDSRRQPEPRLRDAKAAGVAAIPNAPRKGSIRAVAWDAAGNVSLPAIRR